mmetsp:Transcript_68193/g.197700  ORF Transcript_68193/g.197700 Transcript_68193/m.197700 type:complete len:277 (-) Transcript_68193:427-1257(-)
MGASRRGWLRELRHRAMGAAGQAPTASGPLRRVLARRRWLARACGPHGDLRRLGAGCGRRGEVLRRHVDHDTLQRQRLRPTTVHILRWLGAAGLGTGPRAAELRSAVAEADDPGRRAGAALGPWRLPCGRLVRWRLHDAHLRRRWRVRESIERLLAPRPRGNALGFSGHPRLPQRARPQRPARPHGELRRRRDRRCACGSGRVHRDLVRKCRRRDCLGRLRSMGVARAGPIAAAPGGPEPTRPLQGFSRCRAGSGGLDERQERRQEEAPPPRGWRR